MAPYYQPVVDLIATHPPPNGSLDLVLKLCQAAEAEHGERISLLTDQVVKDVNPEMSPPVLIPEVVWYETMARMLFLRERPHLQALLEWYHRPISFVNTPRERLSEHWAGIFQFVTVPPPHLPEKELDRQLTQIITALRCVLAAHATAVAEEDPPASYLPAPGELPPRSFGTPTYHPPPLSAALADGIGKLVGSWMAIHQQFLDAAWQQLDSKKPDRGDKLLALRDRWRRAILLTFGHPRYRNSKPLAELPIHLATIQYGRSPHHRYLDAFLPHEARHFGFKPYDREPQDEPPGKSIWRSDLFQYRGTQLYFLLDAYGVYYPPDRTPRTPVTIAEEKKRKAAYAVRSKLMDRIEKRATVRLQSADDLIGFGCAYFDELLHAKTGQAPSASRLDAWKSLLDFLDRHLNTQTAHTEFNLDDEPPYFDRLFPRAINGGALQDCGVYAVLLSFVFLSLAQCMTAPTVDVKPPHVSFVVLPLHVGLIVEIDPFLPFVVHNNALFRPTDDQLQRARKEWHSAPEKSDPKNPKQRDRMFLEDVAAQMFLRDVDLPLLRLPVAPVSAPPKKREIWKAYQRLVVKKSDRLFSPHVADPTRPEFQFDTRFLTVLTLEKRWYDQHVVPLWNERLQPLWEQRKDGLNDPAKRKAYVKTLEDLLKPVNDSYDNEVRREKDQLTKELRANPELLGPSAQRITRSSRLKVFATSLGPVGQIQGHIAAVTAATGRVAEPPFADKGNLLSRFGD